MVEHRIMDLLKSELPAEKYAVVSRVTDMLGSIPFQYNEELEEFIPADGWFLLADEGEGSGGWEGFCCEDSDTLADIAIECCAILNGHSGEFNLDELADSNEYDGIAKEYTIQYDISDAAFADLLYKSYIENGYKAESKENGAEAWTITVPFTAASDWEYSREKDNITTIYNLVKMKSEGRNPFGTRY